MAIHPTAIIDSKAEISADAEIGPYCVVKGDVRIGARTKLLAHIYLEGKLTIGEDNIFYPYASVGVAPQDKKYKGEASETIIGSANSIREFVTINRGTEGGGMITAIGNGNLLMAYVHVAHDVLIQNKTILANGVTFAGHVTVEDGANIGGHTGIHQFCKIGRYAMVGSYSVIKKNVLPYSVTAAAHETEVYGANRVGLERAGFSSEAIETLHTAFRILTRAGLNTTQALSRMEEELPLTDEIQHLRAFIADAQGGFSK